MKFSTLFLKSSSIIAGILFSFFFFNSCQLIDEFLSDGCGEIVTSVGSVEDVDSVEDLYGFEGDTCGEQISVKSYHLDSDKGGGILCWDADMVRTNHNGGTIFSPARDFSTEGLEAYLGEVTNTDTGCWVRNDVGYVTPEMFGAVGDGVTDDYAAIVAADPVHPVVFTGTYYLSNSINPSNKPIYDDKAFTIEHGIAGVPHSLDGATKSILDFDAKYVSGSSLALLLEEPEFETNQIISISNSTPGSDSDGDYWDLTSAPVSRTNTISITGSSAILVRVWYQGRHLPVLELTFKDSIGAFLKTKNVNWFGGGAEDQTLSNIAYVTGRVAINDIPVNATKLDIVVRTTHFSVEANKADVRMRGADVTEFSDAEFQSFKNLPLPAKGISKQNLYGNQRFVNNSTGITFNKVYSELYEQAKYFKAKGVRLQWHLDEGMNKTSGVYTGFTDATIVMIRNVMCACESLGLKMMHNLFIPDGSGMTYAMDHSAITDPGISDGYANAVTDFIALVDGYESTIAYDLINEPGHMLARNGFGTTYTYAETAALVDKLNSAAKSATDKLIVYSMADGYQGPQHLSYVDETKFDVISYHGYYRPWIAQPALYAYLDKARFSGEIGYASGVTDEGIRGEQTSMAYGLSISYGQGGWIWERRARYYSAGELIIQS